MLDAHYLTTALRHTFKSLLSHHTQTHGTSTSNKQHKQLQKGFHRMHESQSFHLDINL